jgi:hypothetical protein
MTVAFSDVVHLRDTLSSLNDWTDRVAVVKALERDYFVQRKPLASTINILATALYGVFKASDGTYFVQNI